MKRKTIVFLIFSLFGIMIPTAIAIPGIQVITDPTSNTTSGGIADYKVIITNLDDGYDKTITSLSITSSQPGWIYTFDPDLTGVVIPGVNGSNVTTTLHVTPSSSITAGQIYEHQVTAIAQYYVIPGCNDPNNPDCSIGTDSDVVSFNTIIEDLATTQIPEFPTITLPIVSALGIMLIISRRKGRRL